MPASRTPTGTPLNLPVRSRPSHPRRVLAAFSTVALALTFIACSPEASTPTAPPTDTPAPSAQPTDTMPSTPADSADGSTDAAISTPLDASGAVDRALQLAAGAVVELDLGNDFGVQVWEVGVLRTDGSGVELDIAVDTGELRSESRLELDSEKRTAPAVTASAVIDIARGAVPGEVVELDLDTAGSVIVWEVKVHATAGGEYDVDVDAANGTVLKQERDD